MESKYALKMEGISKSYGGNQVLKDINIKVKPGEIHALMGENGAGKSTLMNILFGMSVIHNTGGFEGSIEIEGKKVNIDSPSKAMEAGIGMVHQEFMLIPGFNIIENIKIGREITKPNIISKVLGKSLETLDNKIMREDAKKALDTVGLNIDEYTKVKGLPIGYMQFIEIAREIDKTGLKVLIFDEPTAVLTETESEILLDTIKVIASKGIGIIFVTHRLDEVMSTANTMTVLRDGEFIKCKAVSDTSAEEIAELMIGRKFKGIKKNTEDNRNIDEKNIALRIENLVVDMPGEIVRNVNLEIFKGEIFGIGGLAGQGKLGIPNGIMGLYPGEGDVEIFGKKIKSTKRGVLLKNKVAFVSEDRRGIGILLDESIENNIAFQGMQINNKFLKKYFFTKQVNRKEITEHGDKMIKLLDIRCTSSKQATGRLSGGNQQKVCLATALTLKPEILMVSEPTRGIDVGAKKIVMDHLIKICNEHGVTIIIVSSELEELRSVCDRIAIISDGKVADILKPDDSDVDFGLAMSGKKRRREN